MKYSVVFAIQHDENLLCETRNYEGEDHPCLQGGKVDPIDGDYPTCLLNALKRELNEELNIEPSEAMPPQHISTLKETNRHFHIYHLTCWKGTLPDQIQDTQSPLYWVTKKALVDTVVWPGLKDILQAM